MAQKSVNAESRPVIVLPVDRAGSPDSRSWVKLVPACVISVIVNSLVMVWFFTVSVTGSSTPSTETASIDSEVETATKTPNLENDEIGLNPNVETNYNNTRIEEVSVPGPVNMAEAVGIHEAPNAAPKTLPPPPGISPGLGTGGGVDDPTRVGAGNLSGLPGGLGGPKLAAGGFGGRSGSTRAKLVEQGGGNTQSEAAVAAGLK